MKKLITILAFTLITTMNANAIVCSNNIEAQIGASPTCLAAIMVAEACVQGNDKDIKHEAAANKVCAGKEMKAVPKADVELRKTMEKRCMLICDMRADKHSCLSKISLCQLSAIRYMLHFYPQQK